MTFKREGYPPDRVQSIAKHPVLLPGRHVYPRGFKQLDLG